MYWTVKADEDNIILTRYSYTVVGIGIALGVATAIFWVFAPQKDRTYVFELFEKTV